MFVSPPWNVLNAHGEYLWTAEEDKKMNEGPATTHHPYMLYANYHLSCAATIRQQHQLRSRTSYRWLTDKDREYNSSTLEAYVRAKRTPPRDVLDLMLHHAHLEDDDYDLEYIYRNRPYAEKRGCLERTEYVAQLVGLILSGGWLRLEDMPHTVQRLAKYVPFWLNNDQPMAWVATSQVNTRVAKLMRVRQVSVLTWLYYFKFASALVWMKNVVNVDTGSAVFDARHFAFFREPNDPMAVWYYQRVIEPLKVTLLLGAFHPRVGCDSALFRQFTKSGMGEHFVLDIIAEMAT